MSELRLTGECSGGAGGDSTATMDIQECEVQHQLGRGSHCCGCGCDPALRCGSAASAAARQLPYHSLQQDRGSPANGSTVERDKQVRHEFVASVRSLFLSCLRRPPPVGREVYSCNKRDCIEPVSGIHSGYVWPRTVMIPCPTNDIPVVRPTTIRKTLGSITGNSRHAIPARIDPIPVARRQCFERN